MTDAINRFFIFGDSVSSKELDSDLLEFLLLELELEYFKLAPYPACLTAFMISLLEAVPSTPIELVSKLTAQLVTPGTAQTAFSTRF